MRIGRLQRPCAIRKRHQKNRRRPRCRRRSRPPGSPSRSVACFAKSPVRSVAWAAPGAAEPRMPLLRGRSLGSRRRCALGSRRCPLDRRRRFRFRREQRLRHGCERQNARRHKKTALHDRTPRYCSPSLPDRVTKGCLCCIDVEPSLRSICLRCCKKGSQGDAQGGAGFRVIHAWTGAWKSLRKPVSSRDLPGPN